MPVLADFQTSMVEMQWINDPEGYALHLIEIAKNTYPDVKDLLNSVENGNWFDAENALTSLENHKILRLLFLFRDEAEFPDALHEILEEIKISDKRSLVERLISNIYILEEYLLEYTEKGNKVVNVLQLLEKSEKLRFRKKYLDVYYFAKVLFCGFESFSFDKTLDQMKYAKSEIVVANNFATFIGFHQKRINYGVAEINSGNSLQKLTTFEEERDNNPPVLIAADYDYTNKNFRSLRVGRKSQISFHRTIRIPEDGKDYPLPASLGVLPIHRIEDYAENVPADWLEDGGFFIPLYQREALFLQFEGDSNRPMISKVCVGEINAITGLPYSETLSAHKQDYVVIPTQKWLDGINNGNGTVRQFVAMPLGQGYTVEAQVTDEEKYGGFQLVVYDAVEGRFAEPQIPVSKKIEIVVAACRRRFEQKFEASDTDTRTVIVLVRRGKLTRKDIMRYTGLSEDQINLVYEKFRYGFLQEVVETILNYFNGDADIQLIQNQVLIRLESLGLREEIDPETVVPHDKPPGDETILRSSPDRQHYSEGVLYSSPSRQDPSESAKEMGIAAGGSLEQQIHPDIYGIDTWDHNQRRSIKIRIINSKSYEAITGLPAPDSPVTVEHYQKAGIPWFSNYDENTKSLDGAAPFKRIRGVEEIGRRRGITDDASSSGFKLEPDQIRRIKTPTREEAADELRSIARSDVDAKNWKSAILKIDYLLDLGLEPTSHDYSLRSLCNYHMGRSIEAYVDAESALTVDSVSVLALEIRARCRMSLGDYEGAKEDGVRLATILGSESTGNEIAAEAWYYLGDYDEAVASAQMACEYDPQNSRAAEIATLAKSAPRI